MSWKIEPRDPRTQSEGVVAGYAHTARRWPSQPLVVRPHDVGELSGPERLERRLPASKADLAGRGASRAIGQLIHLRARGEFPVFKLVLVTNAGGLDRPNVKEGLRLLPHRQ